MLVVVGPVEAAAARDWAAHTLANLEVVRARQDLLPFRFPRDVAERFRELLTEWYEHALAAAVFEWSGEFDGATVRHLVQYWANLNSLSHAQVERLGVDRAPQRAQPFFDALARGVAEAFARSGQPDAFAELLLGRTTQATASC